MRKLLTLLCVAALLVLSFTACDALGGNDVLIAKADKTTASPSDTVTLSAEWQGEEQNTVAEGATFEIVSGESATLSGNTLTIAATAADGDVVRVVAKADGKTSAELAITVSVPLTSITVSAVGGATNIAAGGSVILQKTAVPTGADATAITWEIVEGATAATMAGDVLVVNQNAATGTVIKVVAKCGSITSNELAFTVGYPLTGLSLQLIGSANVPNGESRALSVTLTPANTTNGAYTFKVLEGAEYCTLVGNALSVKDTAPIGSVIRFCATAGSIESNTVTVVVGKPITAIVATALGSPSVVKGESCALSATVTPADASMQTLSWVITEGGEYAEIVNGVLLVKATAPTAATIRVKAMSGTVASNELVFTVAPTQAEIEASRLLLSLSKDTIVIDKNKATQEKLIAEIFNGAFDPVTDKTLRFEIVEGASLLTLDAEGYECDLTPVAHGTAKVRVTIDGTQISKDVTVKVIVPPAAIKLPDVFVNRPVVAYTFGMSDPSMPTLGFVATAMGSGVCTDLKYTFAHADGTVGDSVATIDENGNITFKKVGDVTLTVSSNSGSVIETTASYKFSINNGYNVSTFAALRDLVASASYNGQIINVVVTEKTVVNGVDYGYALVPPSVSRGDSATLADLINDGNQIAAYNKSLTIYGNGYTIDGSGLRVIPASELTAQGPDKYRLDYLIGATAPNSNVINRVVINDLSVIGNCPIDYAGDYDTKSGKPVGTVFYGIRIGGGDENVYYTSMKNVTVSKAITGMILGHCISDAEYGLLENITASNCHSNGIETKASILTLKNVTFGPCGATGIELVPEQSNGAPFVGNQSTITYNQNQQITFAGTMDVSFENDDQTVYFQHYKFDDFTIPIILQTAVGTPGDKYTLEQLSHIHYDGNGDGTAGKIYVGLVLNDLSNLADVKPNASVALYPGYQTGGIINLKDVVGIDTVHEYIELDVVVNIGMEVNVGKALFYNHHYIPQ